MWVLLAFLSAVFAGLTAILAKIGLRDTDSTLATALRTVVVLVFSFILVSSTGALWHIGNMTFSTLFFLGLSGIATGLSWLCYFRALQMGDVSKVVPIDKSSTILTMVFAISFLGETAFLASKILGMVLIALGTALMLLRAQPVPKAVPATAKGGMRAKIMGAWWFFAILAALFSGLTAVLGKVGIENVDSNLGTTIRTAVVLLMAWAIVFLQNKQGEVKTLSHKAWLFLVLSGITTGLSWLFYYKALQDGLASVVVPIDKLSIWVTVFFGTVILKEKMGKKQWLGLGVLTLGTLVLLLKF